MRKFIKLSGLLFASLLVMSSLSSCKDDDEPDSPKVQSFTVNGVSFNMITVDGGTFTMGGSEEQGTDTTEYELPTHKVKVSTFAIGETEVTQELWVAVMGENPSEFNGWHERHQADYGTNLKRPVENVSWLDCQTFIAKLNSLTGKKFRLPTEAEWEFAARGGKKSQHYKFAGSNNPSEVAWSAANRITKERTEPGFGPQPVASLVPNELGLYDMSGNVWEWCQDFFGRYTADEQTNPVGPESGISITPYVPTTGTEHVTRGGGWSADVRLCRVSYRIGSFQEYKNYLSGLRLAL